MEQPLMPETNNIATNTEISSALDDYQCYQSYQQAIGQLYELAPLDYFLAKELVEAVNEHISNNNGSLSPNDYEACFHLFVALSQSLRDGHACLPISEIAGQRIGYASDDECFVTHHGYVFGSLELLEQLCLRLLISPKAMQLVVYYQGNLYLRRYFQFEQALLTDISAKLATDLTFDSDKITTCLESLFPHADRDVNEIDWQLVAVANALNKNLSVIAGGPGTGKTYTVTKLLAALVDLQATHAINGTKAELTIVLTAPTGKAAQRLSESISNTVQQFTGKIAPDVLNKIPKEAKTLHRLLGVIPNSPNFKHDQDNRLALDVLLIDEVSMVDLPMMTRVMRALPPHAKVILLGDADQLPSVAAGSVLADLAPRPHSGYSIQNIDFLSKITQMQGLKSHQVNKKNSAQDHITFLTKSRRFDGEGNIGQIAQMVITGDANNSWAFIAKPSLASLNNNQQYPLLLKQTQDDWLPKMVCQYFEPLFTLENVEQAFEQLSRFRILCATRKGECGVEQLNEKVKQILVNKGLVSHQQQTYHGQPIMIGENDYRLGLYNGDVGIIWRHALGHLMAVFEGDDGTYRWVMPSRLPNFEAVFAMTIHKTQGSEFNHVVMVLPHQKDNRLLSRELLYTGITRAKSWLSISSLENVWQRAVNAKTKRYSGFKL